MTLAYDLGDMTLAGKVIIMEVYKHLQSIIMEFYIELQSSHKIES